MKLNLEKIEVEFLPDGHTYTIGGKLVPGVTTILKVLNKPALVGWAAKMVWSELTGKFGTIVGMVEEEYEKFILEAKGASRRKSKEALSSGTIAHDWIEQYVKGKMIAEKELVPPMPSDEKATASIGAFLKWEEQNKVEWLASELILGSIKEQFCGTVDAVAVVNGKLSVIDFKTSSGIWDEYHLQTAGYYILLDENLAEGEPRPTQRIIIRLPKDGAGFEENVRVNNLKFDCDTFIHCREVERWMSNAGLVGRLNGKNYDK